jgi:ABC-type multidrug transport system ATPase subunit
MTCVSTRRVTRRFGDRVALDSADIDVEPDRIVGLLGRMGRGREVRPRRVSRG